MRLTERDFRIINAVEQFRLLTAPQIEALFFPSPRPRGCRTSCQRRLQLLFHHAYLERHFQPIIMGEGKAPIVYSLAKKGADLLASHTGRDRASLNWRPKKLSHGYDSLSHRLKINDFRIATILICNSPDLKLQTWLDEGSFRTPALEDKVPMRNHGGRPVRNFPDGYFALEVGPEDRKAHFFLEVDMGTMSHKRWQDKIRTYVAFRDRGLARKHYGSRNFRLLVVTTSQQRLKGLVQSTEKAGGDRYFWFTTLDQIDIWQPERLLQPIWTVTTFSEPMPLFRR